MIQIEDTTLGEDPKVLPESNAGSCAAVEERLLEVGGWREGTCRSSGLGAPATKDDEEAEEELCSGELVTRWSGRSSPGAMDGNSYGTETKEREK